MKFAYLIHTYREYEEIIETVNQLIKQGDHVFIMINDNDLRDKIYFVYADSDKVHISHIQEYAQEGDLSLARGTILQMKEAVEREGVEFDYYINLTDGMMPIKKRSEIVTYLTNNPNNYYYVECDDSDHPELRKRLNSYYVFTNLIAFVNGRFTRAFTKGVSKAFYTVHIRKKHEDKIFLGSPYFIINHDAAKVLVKHYDYVSMTFKLSWYAEEMYIPMMMNKFYNMEHVNSDLRVLGPNGSWTKNKAPRELTREVIEAHPEALFGGQILADSNLDLYEDYFDIYNNDYVDKQKEHKQKEMIDPEIIRKALDK